MGNTEEKTLDIKQNFTDLAEIQKGFTADQVKFVMSTVAPGLNDKEVWLFLLKANKLGLNPLLGEIFAYVYVDRQTNQRRLVIIEGRNGKRNLAAKSGNVEYVKTEAIYIKEVDVPANQEAGTPAGKMNIKVEPWDGKLWGARSEVKVKGIETPFVETVKFDEYNTGKSVWASKPETMIKKVAESQALSAALPQLMLDLYGEGENFTTAEQPKALPTVQNADEPANETQLATLKSLGADMSKKYTGQEAIEEMERLTTEKRQAKKAEKAAAPAEAEAVEPTEGKA